MTKCNITIDTSFDFTTDTPEFWEGFWDRRGGLGLGGNDPDSASKTLQEYHRQLWSKMLPCGEKMELRSGYGSSYLTWKDFRFGSDSLSVSFNYLRNRSLLEQVAETVPNYRQFVEDYMRSSYTIGAMIIFPRHQNSINQRRGTNQYICDRWDLTLECIRRHYAGEDSPLSKALKSDKKFFDLFVDFKGYVDYFFLQDCVPDDYSKVKIWYGKGDLSELYPMPKTVAEYLRWIDDQKEFTRLRNKKIEEFVKASNSI